MSRLGDPGRRLSDAERMEARERIAVGQTHAQVAQAIGCSTKSIQRLLIRTGGLPPRPRARSSKRLTLAEREESPEDSGRVNREVA